MEDLAPGLQVFDLWYPLLSDDADQRVLDVSIDVPGEPGIPFETGHDPEHGNSMLHLRLPRPSRQGLEFAVSYLVTRSDAAAPAETAVDRRRPRPLMARELEVDLQLADFDWLRRTAADAARGQPDPLVRAECLRDVLPGGEEPVLVERFVALCRLSGIPARLVAGLRVGAGPDVHEHLWAELFVADRGWVAVDPVCSVRRVGHKLCLVGLDHVSRTRGQRLLLQPAQRGPRLGVLCGPYAEADGRPHPVQCLRRARVEGPDGAAAPAGARVPDLGTLLAEELELLHPGPPVARLGRGSALPPVIEDEWLYVVSRGCVRLSRVSVGGRSLELAVLAAPAFFLADRRRRGVVEALEDSELRCLTREQVLQVARRRPDFGFRLLETFGQRLTESEDRLEYLAYHGVPARLALALLRRRGPDGAVDGMTHQQLGDIVGASRETVTKVLSQLQAEGTVRVLPRHIEVLDPDDLARRLAG